MYGIRIETGTDISIPRQICNQLRILIESGELKKGERLPPTRKIAGEWNINRNIVVEVYEQLIAEGYLESRTGSGTFVASGINTPVGRPDGKSKEAPKSRPAQDIPSNRKECVEFETGVPDLALFPSSLWGKYLKQASENLFQPEDSADIMGDTELRSILCAYVRKVKGIQCVPEQIMIVSGSSGGFLLIAQALSKTCGEIFVEDPTVDFTRDIFFQMGYITTPIPVDKNGMVLSGLEPQKGGEIILLTPSHQFPTGSILSLQRRFQVIEIAERSDSYIIEDDFDSEFRFKGMPIPPLQVLSPSRVIYAGTFSKTLHPGLRLGFLIIPDQLADTLKAAKSNLNIYHSVIEQRALANFIRDGHYDRHVYKMKNIYKRRRAYLIQCLLEHFGEEIEIVGDEAGMHVQVEFTNPGLPRIDWDQSRRYGIAVEPVEEYCLIKGNNRNRIVLGYGNIGQSRMEEGIKRLDAFYHSFLP